MSDDLVRRLRDTPNWMREGFQDWKDNMRTYDRAPFEAADRIKELEAKLAKAVELVERAFNEGVGEGMNDVLRQSGGKTWYDSRSRKRLAELTGGKDEDGGNPTIELVATGGKDE